MRRKKSRTWFFRAEMKNCKRCASCKDNRHVRPHGPYIEMRRYATHGHDKVYLGVLSLPDNAERVVNTLFSGDEIPTRQQVVEALNRTRVEAVVREKQS